MNITTTDTLITTISALNRADSLMPTIRMPEIMAMISAAGRLTTPGLGLHGEASRDCGRLMPNDFSIESTVADQLTETVAAPTAYSNTSAQPMIQATISPSVA